jgi:hypothetical protein
MKYLILIILVGIIVSFNGFSQSDDLMEPPSKQNTYYFSIEKFNRQPKPPKYILDQIEIQTKKPRSKWSQEDSLFFAYKQVHSENFGLALSIFTKLKTDTIKEPHALRLYHVTLYMNDRFRALKNMTVYESSENETELQSKEDIRQRILNVKIKALANSWSIEDSLVFPFLNDQSIIALRKSRTDTKQKLVPLIENVDQALRIFVLLHDDRDVILSQAYQEIADFQSEHFYVSNAYLYNSIALHYNKNNKKAVQNANRLTNTITKRNYLLPSFRNKFGKVISNRFHFEEMETAKEISDDSMHIEMGRAIEPPKKEMKKDYLPWLDGDLIIVIGLFILLIIVVVILKPIKSND